MNDSISKHSSTGDAGSPSTREALLREAKVLFTQKGFRGASVRDITRAAGANLGSITYHFGTKWDLYEEVLNQVLTPLIEAVEEAVAEPSPPKAMVNCIDAFLNYLREHEETPQLMLRELASAGAPPDPVRRLAGTFRMGIGQVIQRGQEQGLFRQGPHQFMAFSLASQPIHLFLAYRKVGPAFGADLDDDHDFQILRSHLIAFTLGGFGYTEGEP